ncbi:MAG: hypothetical protein IKP52_03175 [Prevotella sp.]|nr:hypothetical protein [Prevotella sp.]
MRNFNIKRFWQVMKWQLMYHQAKNMKRLLTCAGVMFFFMLFFSYTSVFTEQFTGAMSSLLFAAFTIYLLFCGSFILRMNKRQEYIDKLMVPASRLEKYVASYVLTIVLGLAMIAVAFVAADVVNYLVILILNSEKATLVTLSLFSLTGETEPATFAEIVASLLSCWWIHSLYLVGGTYFRKRHWIFTTLTLIAAFIVIGGGLTFLGWKAMNLLYGDYFRVVFIDGAETIIEWGSAIITIAFIALNYWLSYRFYKRIQLIGHKFTNR